MLFFFCESSLFYFIFEELQSGPSLQQRPTAMVKLVVKAATGAPFDIELPGDMDVGTLGILLSAETGIDSPLLVLTGGATLADPTQTLEVRCPRHARVCFMRSCCSCSSRTVVPRFTLVVLAVARDLRRRTPNQLPAARYVSSASRDTPSPSLRAAYCFGTWACWWSLAVCILMLVFAFKHSIPRVWPDRCPTPRRCGCLCGRAPAWLTALQFSSQCPERPCRPRSPIRHHR